MSKILLVDDEGEALLSLSRALKSTNSSFVIEGVTNADNAIEAVQKNDSHVAIVDLSLDPKSGVESGFDLVKKILAIGNRCKVIVLTGHSSVENGVRALNLGASHFLEKPPDIAHLSSLIKDCIAQSELYRNFQSKSRGIDSLILTHELLGQSEQIENLRDEILFAASTNQSIFLVGETGSGKTLCASLIHRLSERSTKSFVCYTPGYQNADLVNSDLYGHLKGAFTGAIESRVGLLQEADGGTFFLDEVDELPTDTQISLLRVMHSKEFRALGSNKDQQSDFRLISATNKTQQEIVAFKKLREDFYHRIAHRVINIPSLRERKLDIEALSNSFLHALNRKEHLQVLSIEKTALAKLQAYNWPGNIRELQAVIEGAAYMAQFKGRTSILESDLQLGSKVVASDEEGQRSFHQLVEKYKESLVLEAMEKSAGNQVQAAKLLGLDRSSLRRILGKE